MKLYDTGVYLQNGQEIIPENQADLPVAKEEAAKNTIAYSILKAHNKSDNMEKLQIKFDKLTSHDITFVGIIQTARASGGTFGNHISKGQEFLPLITSEEQLFRVTDAAIQFFDDHANPGERFKFTIDRVGAEKLQEVLKGAYNG